MNFRFVQGKNFENIGIDHGKVVVKSAREMNPAQSSANNKLQANQRVEYSGYELSSTVHK